MVAVTMMQLIFVLIAGASLLGLCHGQVQCTTEEYIARLSDIDCTQMHMQAIIDAYTQCGRDDLAGQLVDNCRTNQNDSTCGELSLLIAFRNPIEIQSCYRDNTFEERILQCTAECKEDLEVYINDNLGCCSRSIFEDELLTAYSSIALMRNLTDICNVSLVQNRCTTPSSLSYTPSGAAEPICTGDELSHRVVRIPACSRAYLEPRIALARSCGFPANEVPLTCEADDDGVICISYYNDTIVRTIVDPVELNCINGTNSCTEACRAAVVNFRENLGCCVNNLYNNSLHSIYGASYELWSLCEVETVGICRSGQAPTVVVTKLLFAIAFLALALLF